MAEFIIPRKGPPRAIYSETAAEIAQTLGKVTTMRASHVEPTEELSERARAAIWDRYTDDNATLPGGPTDDVHACIYPPSKWWADCTVVDGPVLGPFNSRAEALEAESKWLLDHNIPVCRECRGESEEARYTVQIEPPDSEPVDASGLDAI